MSGGCWEWARYLYPLLPTSGRCWYIFLWVWVFFFETAGKLVYINRCLVGNRTGGVFSHEIPGTLEPLKRRGEPLKVARHQTDRSWMNRFNKNHGAKMGGWEWGSQKLPFFSWLKSKTYETMIANDTVDGSEIQLTSLVCRLISPSLQGFYTSQLLIAKVLSSKFRRDNKWFVFLGEWNSRTCGPESSNESLRNEPFGLFWGER